MAQIKFSIVITTYNRLSLLRRAIDCALGQTVPCEVVVADDCSTDDTQEYLRSLGDRIVYHRNSTNQGHAATMNAGVQAAQGDWIKPMDDDDYLAANCVEEMANAIALRPQAVICSCQAAQVDVNEVEISRTRKNGPGKAFYVPQADIHYGMLLELIPFGTPIQVAFRRDAFLQSGGWDSQLDVNFDDIDSWLRISQFGDAVFINQCLAYRTVWPGSYNQKFSLVNRLNTHLLIKDKIYALVNEQHRSVIPKPQSIKSYLKLHWSLVALKQRKLLMAIKLIFPAVFSLKAWNLLISAILARSQTVDLLFKKQIDKDIELKEKTYNFLNQQQRDDILDWEEFRAYLQLHGGWSAWKQGHLIAGIKIALPALFSWSAWKVVVKAFLLEQEHYKKPLIRKVVLIE